MELNESLQKNTPNEIPKTFERAAVQLNHDKEKIKALWEKKVREKVFVAEKQTSLALINSMDAFLNSIVVDLQQSALNSTAPLNEQDLSKSHGGQRALFVGYFLPQLLKEFSILREVITSDLQDAGILTFEILTVVNGCIDSAISSAATEFAAVQQASIKAALQKAEESNQDLEHFAAVAAHDLKSPLATISGYLELLSEESSTQLGKESLEYITLMQKASIRMRNLIDRLLDYARLTDSDKAFKVVDINNVLKSVAQNLHDTIEKNEAKITWSQFPNINGDAELLIQLFQNLIANSLKFRSQETPIVKIEATHQKDMILFSLKDNGIGFESKDKENIFALYKKLHGESDYQGSGIGLATCRKVVELHGGRIWAESKPGAGSTFYFTLPSATAHSTT